MGGPGMRAAKMLASGDLQIIILSLLNEKPRHGYEVIKALEEHSSGVYTPSPGMVYPALTYLEEMGYAVATAEGTKKLYTITETGKETLEKNRASVDETMEHLARFGRRISQFQKQFTDDENAAEDFGHDPRGQAKNEWRQMKAEFRDLRDELKAAIYEKLGASMEEKKRILDVLKRAIDEIRGK
jgi:DNA-binding PadR family transcriptional regulator